ncbi:S8 family peptidase [Kribbella sp. NBC_01505]|uniref:S8 family peptidase n=1 Tax=Kribbella sp. NBC_01505 TaxID=2903580 RepID=UPI003863EA38
MSRPALSALLGLSLVAGALSVVTAQAAPPPPAPSDGLPRVQRPTTVTLVTGDKVTLTPEPDGTTQITTTPRPGGFQAAIKLVESKNRRLALPQDAAPFVAAGVLDETLFDIGYLVDNGFADDSTQQLPLITQLSSTVPAAKVRSTADAVPGVAPTRELASLHATAADVPKSQASAFWTAVAGAKAPQRGQAAARSFGSSVSKVWLDRKVHATLDRSVPMIGAPQAWAAGYDGKGVKVAVLDTGIDANHPDLKGRVTASRNFSADPDLSDGYGHGTHVASIITGSGAASGGKYQGVAPKVDLMVGKVLDHSGTGAESDVIAGMEWAAAQGARVINLSLGGDLRADESQDPSIIAVNRLTAETGALFVVAAGNSGQAGASTVGSPGAAGSALTVAAVDKSDQLAPYSSLGPLLYPDHISKPDIAGPGSDIVAARATGTSMGSPVDSSYTSASGTSMATPHVAGAAAILAQEHPDWSAAQLKAVLMSTSKDDKYTVFQQGAGRVDIARAISQQVVATTSGVDYGRILDTETGDLVKQISYRNDSAADVTLGLATAGTSTAVSVPPQVVVPAHATATADVTMHAGQLSAGYLSGAVVATAPGVQLRTPVALRKTAKTFPVQVEMKFSAPVYFSATVSALNLDDSDAPILALNYARLAPDLMSASLTLELPPGRWSVTADHDRLPEGRALQQVYYAAPELDVRGPTTVAFDDKDAVPFRMTTDTPTQPMAGGYIARRATTDGKNWLTETMPFSQYDGGTQLMTPTPAVTTGTFHVKFDATRGVPRVQLTVDSANGRGTSMRPNYRDYGTYDPRFDGTHRKLPLVDVGASLDPDELAKVRGKLVLMSYTWGHGGYSCELLPDDVIALEKAGALGVLQELGECGLYGRFPPPTKLPIADIDKPEGVRLRELLEHGPVTVTLKGVPNSPVVYHLATSVVGRIPEALDFRVRDSELAKIRTSYTPEWSFGQFGFRENVGQRLDRSLEPTLFTWPTMLPGQPQTRDEYFGPIKPGQQWIRSATTDMRVTSMEERRLILRPGPMPDERWFGAPRGTGPADVPPAATNLTHMGFCFACRDGDRLVVVPQFANPDPLVIPSLLVEGTRAKLYRDGQEIPGADSAFPTFTLPSAAGRYKLVLDSDLSSNAADLYRYGAKQHTEWTFGSQHVDKSNLGNSTCYQAWPANPALPCAPQQLLYLRYSAPTDQSNKVRGLVPLQIRPYYERTADPQSAQFASVRVSASYDAGKTWKVVAGVNLGSVYQALFVPPRGSQTVSLRVEAKDRKGNTISQTIDDIVGVR